MDWLRQEVANAVGTGTSHVLLNWNHTHLAPPGGLSFIRTLAQVDETGLGRRIGAYVDELHQRVIAVAREAAERLEPARVVWGIGSLDDAVNRRERRDGRVVLGWYPDGDVDRSVTVLQARRPDESAIATLVGYGCHTVTTGPGRAALLVRLPGALREAVRAWTGGECVFFQGAAGNVIPLCAFFTDEWRRGGWGAPGARGDASLADRRAWPALVSQADGAPCRDLLPLRGCPGRRADLGSRRGAPVFPLLPVPTLRGGRVLRGGLRGGRPRSREARGPARPGTWVAYHARWANAGRGSRGGGAAAADGPSPR